MIINLTAIVTAAALVHGTVAVPLQNTGNIKGVKSIDITESNAKADDLVKRDPYRGGAGMVVGVAALSAVLYGLNAVKNRVQDGWQDARERERKEEELLDLMLEEYGSGE